MILLLKVKLFRNVFMIIRLKYRHDNLNILVVFAPGRVFFSAKYAQYPLTFTE